MKRGKRHWKLWQKMLLALGIIIAVIVVAGLIILHRLFDQPAIRMYPKLIWQTL